MATFEPRKPIETRDPVIVVDAGLQPGRYRFQLIVENEAGIQSVAVDQIVQIRRSIRPRPRPLANSFSRPPAPSAPSDQPPSPPPKNPFKFQILRQP